MMVATSYEKEDNWVKGYFFKEQAARFCIHHLNAPGFVCWHTPRGIKVHGGPVPLKDLPTVMPSLETFWKTLIKFKVNREPFHSASPPLPYPGSKILYTYPHSSTELQEHRPFSRGTGSRNPRGEPSHSREATFLHLKTTATPDCIQEVLLSRIQNAQLALFGQKAPSAIVVVVVIWGCCQLLQELAIKVWLVVIQFWEPAIQRRPRFGETCRCLSQTRTRGQGTW